MAQGRTLTFRCLLGAKPVTEMWKTVPNHTEGRTDILRSRRKPDLCTSVPPLGWQPAVIHMTHCPIFWLLEERQADFFLLFPPFIENRFIIYSDYGFPYPPLFFPAPPHLPAHLDPLPFCLPLENERLLRGNKIWHNKSTLELDKTTKQKGKSPREGTRNRDLLVCIQNHLKTLDWKPYCMCREPGIDLCRPYAYCFVICEFR